MLFHVRGTHAAALQSDDVARSNSSKATKKLAQMIEEATCDFSEFSIYLHLCQAFDYGFAPIEDHATPQRSKENDSRY